MTSRGEASRRDALKTAALGASGLATAVAVTRIAGRGSQARATAPASGSNPAENVEEARATYLADLVGVEIGDYRVVHVGALERGGVPVYLAHRDGSRFRVDVLRADPSAAKGVGVASAVAVYVHNGGDGRTATDEVMGVGAMALADELARRQSAGQSPPAALLTMGERDSAFRIG